MSPLDLTLSDTRWQEVKNLRMQRPPAPHKHEAKAVLHPPVPTRRVTWPRRGFAFDDFATMRGRQAHVETRTIKCLTPLGDDLQKVIMPACL